MNLLSDFNFSELSFWFSSDANKEFVHKKEQTKSDPISTKYVFSNYFAPEKLTEAVKKVVRSLVFKNISFTGEQLREMKKQFPSLRFVTFEGCKVNNKSTFKVRDVSTYLEDIGVQKL